MATSLTAGANALRYPAGLVGEAPDIPSDIQKLAVDVDAYIGNGGAETVATSAAMGAIPSARKFTGKLVYRSDVDTLFRYVGAGNTALGANASGSAWQGWEKPATPFTPVWSAGIGGGTNATYTAIWGISAGTFWLALYAAAGTGWSVSTTVDTALTLPSGIVAPLGGGSGVYTRGGSTSPNQQADLATMALGTPGTSSTQLRLRAKYANAAPGGVNDNILGSVVASTTADTMQVHFQAPSAAVA